MTRQKTDNDVLLQTRVPPRVAREVGYRAEAQGDTNAGWLRRLIIEETNTPRSSDYLKLGHQFIRPSAIVYCRWVDPNAGTCADGRDPWVLEVTLSDGSRLFLSDVYAATVLQALELPTANPHPKGTKS